MMIEQAMVLSYQNGIAKIQCFAKSSCGGCGAASGCGTKALSALAGEKTAPQFELAVPEILQCGDKIEIGISEQRLLFSVFWLFVLPLIVLVGSALLFSQWIENELWVAALILMTLGVTFYAIKKRIEQTASKVMPVFVRKIEG